MYNGILFIIFTIIFLCLCIYFRKNHANIRGKKGEQSVSKKLHSLPKEYFIFNDIYLNIGNNSVQIDHVIISRYGIFVIETKNYTGWIYGGDSSEFWTKNVYGNKYEFRNPLKQNYSHVKALQTLFGITHDNLYFSIVVFLDKATLKCKKSENVVYLSELTNLILSKNNPKLSDESVNKLSAILTENSINDKKQKQKHIERIQQNITDKHILISKGICPICKGKLIKRKGKHGYFIGCSNYPYCRFTHNID